jgi:hypothetical protein
VFHKRKFLCFLFLLGSMVLPLATASSANAAKLTLSWADNSDSENGFRIERRLGAVGSYQQLAQIAANTATYTDNNLAGSTTYCYRVSAFNATGSSSYSNENCATTAAESFTLTVSRSGTGTGSIVSSPAGINCSADCAENYTGGTVVTLTAVPANGSIFSGWSGHADCADGNVVVSAAIQCTATFTVSAAVVAHTLNVTVANEVTAKGAASGRVFSNPAGIDCGSDCTESYPIGRIVALTAVPAANSKFAGWTGDADCSDNSVTMDRSKGCTARFQLNMATLSVTKKGKGKVSGAAAGIDCGASCVHVGAIGSAVSLRATAEAGSVFLGWSGGCAGTGDCATTLASDTSVTANFASFLADKIGIYRPATGSWLLDRNGSGTWEGCQSDICIQFSGGSGTIPLVGDWNKSGATKIGFFVSESSEWFLDANGNGLWDGCQIDICSSFGDSSDIPLVGQWTRGGEDRIAIFRPSEKKWHLDSNGNETLEPCKKDKCPVLSVYQAGDLPLIGDWAGRGTSQVGFFRPSTGEWFLDRGANSKWNGCKKDVCAASFGSAGDIPVAGDWNGNGISKIGIFRPSSGEWFLDLNGNGAWDGPALDLYVSGYGQAGDIPVVGKW